MFKGTQGTGSPGLSFHSSIANRNRSLADRQCGFSVVELLMTILLVAIGTAVALPSYHDMVGKRQVTNAAEQIASFVNTAQGVAMKTNRVVTVSYARADADDWCIGAVASETACLCSQADPEAADYCQIDSRPFVIDAGHAGGLEVLHSVTGDGAYAFDPIRGLFRDLDDSLTMELHSRNGDFRLNVLVNSSGRVVICSVDEGHAIPGYAVCGAALVPEPLPPEPEPLPGPEPLPVPEPLPEM